jgi:adenosylcobinamide hydrolase
VRDALRVSLRSRYGPDVGDAPSSVAAAEYGVSTERTAAVSVPTER